LGPLLEGRNWKICARLCRRRTGGESYLRHSAGTGGSAHQSAPSASRLLLLEWPQPRAGAPSGKRSQKARPLTVIAKVCAKSVNELFLA